MIGPGFYYVTDKFSEAEGSDMALEGGNRRAVQSPLDRTRFHRPAAQRRSANGYRTVFSFCTRSPRALNTPWVSVMKVAGFALIFSAPFHLA